MAVKIPTAPPGATTHALGWHLEDLTDFEFRLVVDFEPFTIKLKKRMAVIRPVFSWKRSRRVVMIRGKGSIGLTTEAKHWAKAAAAQLRDQWGAVGLDAPIPRGIMLNAAITSYLPTAALPDASNLYQGVEDAMSACRGGARPCKPSCNRHAGVYVDDVQVQTHNGSDRLIDRERPRVEIVLTPHGRSRPFAGQVGRQGKTTHAHAEIERLRKALSGVLAWVGHPALSRVCAVADTHGFGITKDEARDGHAALAAAAALLGEEGS